MTSESIDPPPSTWLTSRGLVDSLQGRRDNDVKVSLQGILVPIQSVRYHPVADAYVIELVAGEDLRVALEPDQAPPHVWDFESQTWTCLACKQISADPCQCGCHEESDVHYQFHGKNSVNLLLDHRHACHCVPLADRGVLAGTKPGEEQLNSPRMEKIDPLCIAGVLISNRRPT